MVSIKFQVSTALAGLALATLAGAQNLQQSSNFRAVDGPLTRVKYDVPTGQVTRLGEGRGMHDVGVSAAGVQKAFANCFDNSLTTGYYTGGTNGFEFMDFASKACAPAQTDVQGAFSFAYATTARDLLDTPPGTGASLAITFYSGASAFCASAGTFEGGFLFTGLPGAIGTQVSPGFLVTAVFGGNSTFTLPDGPIGWGYTPFEGAFGTAAFSGPLLTEFSVNTGWGDVFDIYNRVPATTGTCLGAFFFGGCTPPVPPPTTGVPCGGFYMKLFGVVPKASACVMRNPCAPVNISNYVCVGSDITGDCVPDGVGIGPYLSENWITAVGLDPGHQASIVIITKTPLPICLPLGGIFGGTGLLCAPPILAIDAVFGAGFHCIPIPKDLGLLSNTFCTQGISAKVIGGFQLRLRNALDITIGIR